MSIQYVFIYLLIITCIALISSVASLPITDDNQCVTQSGGRGSCVAPRDCEALVANKIKLTMCNKCKTPGLICCPSLNKSRTNRIESNQIVPAIINGRPVEKNQYPFMVALGKKLHDTIEWSCGGTIISTKLILTAAHCRDITHIAVGTNSLVDVKPNEAITEFEFIQHEQYHQDQKGRPNDIAMIKLKTELTFNEAVSSIALAPKSDDETTLPHVATVIGFGSTQMYGQKSSKILAQVDLEKVPCPDYLNPSNQICYFGSNFDNTEIQSTCHGDSGGPLFVRDSNGEYVIFGIVSYSFITCALTPSVFTSIPLFRDWISSQSQDII